MNELQNIAATHNKKHDLSDSFNIEQLISASFNGKISLSCTARNAGTIFATDWMSLQNGKLTHKQKTVATDENGIRAILSQFYINSISK